MDSNENEIFWLCMIESIINMLNSPDRGDVLLGVEYFNKLSKDEKIQITDKLSDRWIDRYAKDDYINPGRIRWYAFNRDYYFSDGNIISKYAYITLVYP